MYQPWLVSHLNGRSDKGSLSGGPGEMLSRSHALTPRDVYRDVIIEPKYFVNALPRWNEAATLTTGANESPAERHFLVDEGHAIGRRNWLISMFGSLALRPKRLFVGPRDDRSREDASFNGE